MVIWWKYKYFECLYLCYFRVGVDITRLGVIHTDKKEDVDLSHIKIKY